MKSFVRQAFCGALGLVTVASTAALVTAAPASATSVTSAATVSFQSPTAHPTFSSSLRWPFVRPGARGERVVAIQYLLQNKGFHRLRADGIYGPRTTAAVRSFQRSHHLNPSGNVGPSTWNRLIVTLRRGDTGSAVRALQHNLKFAYGFPLLRVSGFFGHHTRAAVLAFQRGSHLAITGVVGHRFWKTMIVFER
jgi:peptidoglycan hydrolase-like protein with peptidoglycan-binding domain